MSKSQKSAPAKRSKFNYGFIFSSAAFIGSLLSTALALAVVWLLNRTFGVWLGIPYTIRVLLISILSGAAIAVGLSKIFVSPMMKLGDAMRKVAGGDFSVRLDCTNKIRDMREVYGNISLRNLQECYNDAIYYRDEMRKLFSTGRVNLRQRTLSERFFWAIIMRIAQEKVKLKTVPRDLQDIDVSLADIYYGNFSVFQSLPDSWAIDQLFPVMPVHRLNEFPSRQGIISDITCDSDGRIDHFIDPQGLKTTLDLHPLKDGEEYYLGVFLVGAYQETLGDLHNLMGDTNVVSIRVNPDGGYEYVREIRGDSVADILSYVEYDPRRILDDLRATAERAVRAGRLTPSDRFAVLQAFEDGLRGYTYFER